MTLSTLANLLIPRMSENKLTGNGEPTLSESTACRHGLQATRTPLFQTARGALRGAIEAETGLELGLVSPRLQGSERGTCLPLTLPTASIRTLTLALATSSAAGDSDIPGGLLASGAPPGFHLIAGVAKRSALGLFLRDPIPSPSCIPPSPPLFGQLGLSWESPPASSGSLFPRWHFLG